MKVVDALPRFFANSDRVWLLSPSMPLDIISKDNLFDLEGKLRVLESEPEGAEATIRLARQTSGDFFCESRIATIIATCARRFALVTRDWHNLWEPHLLQEHFGASLAGLTAALYSRQLTNIVHVQFPQSSTELLERITTAGGILEPSDSNSTWFGPVTRLAGLLRGVTPRQAHVFDSLQKFVVLSMAVEANEAN